MNRSNKDKQVTVETLANYITNNFTSTQHHLGHLLVYEIGNVVVYEEITVDGSTWVLAASQMRLHHIPTCKDGSHEDVEDHALRERDIHLQVRI